jgi:peptidoglycan L-alanyl-D-glutamate endopeptidase CwlK
MDKLTIDRIAQSHPKIREELKLYYTECNNKLPKGVRLRFAYVYRSIAEQNVLYNQRPKVTNAKGGQSIHNYGLALDYVIMLDKDNNGTFETIEWDLKSPYHKVVVDYFKSKNYEWFANSLWPGDGKGTNKEIFKTYLTKILLLNLPKDSYLIIDNASFHKGEEIENLIKESNIKLIYLPTYSPDLNPIEKKWAQVKYYYRKLTHYFEDKIQLLDLVLTENKYARLI